MSAPPIGKVTPIPNNKEPKTSSQTELIFQFWTRSISAINEIMARDILIKCLILLWVQLGVDNQPCSLAMATIEPEKVIDPTNIVIDIEIMPTYKFEELTLLKLLLKIASPRATSNEDMPPQPLNRATVSGIEVIGTLLAVMTPKRLPIVAPTNIQDQE